MIRFVAILLLALGSAAFDYSGTYQIETVDGLWVLELLQDSQGGVVGQLRTASDTCVVSGEYSIDEDDETNVDGHWECEGSGGAEFSVYGAEDEDWELLMIPIQIDGTPRADLAQTFSLQPVPSAEETDTELQTHPGAAIVGFWSTQVIMNSEAGSIATELLMEIRADGRLFDRGSRAVGGGADWSGGTGFFEGGQSARWRTVEDRLEISPDGVNWVHLARFELGAGKLFLHWYDGTQALWYNVQP